MYFDPKTFVSDVQGLIASNQKNLRELILRYCWAAAGENLKEIKAYWSDYSQGWLQTQIALAHNINAQAYVATALRFGGGRAEDHLLAGIAILERIGVWDCLRAHNVLLPGEIDDLRAWITEETTPKAFRDEVNRIRKSRKQEEKKQTPKPTVALNYHGRVSVPDEIPPESILLAKQEDVPVKEDYKQKYEEACAEIARLREELERKNAILEKFKAFQSAMLEV